MTPIREMGLKIIAESRTGDTGESRKARQRIRLTLGEFDYRTLVPFSTQWIEGANGNDRHTVEQNA